MELNALSLLAAKWENAIESGIRKYNILGTEKLCKALKTFFLYVYPVYIEKADTQCICINTK